MAVAPNAKDHAKHAATATVNTVPLGALAGSALLSICEECHYVVKAECLHDVNRWDPNTNGLACKLCGLDMR